MGVVWVWCVYNVAAERSDYIKCYLRGAAMLMWSGEERFGVSNAISEGLQCWCGLGRRGSGWSGTDGTAGGMPSQTGEVSSSSSLPASHCR